MNELVLLRRIEELEKLIYRQPEIGGVWKDWTPEAVGLTTPVYTEQTGRIAVIGNVVVGYFVLRMNSYAGYTGTIRITPPPGVTVLYGSGGIYSSAAPQENLRQIELYLGNIVYIKNDFSTVADWMASGLTLLKGSFIGET